MVPVSYKVILSAGIPPAVAIRTALGTTLMVILPTVISGAFGHKRKNAIDGKIALGLGSSGLTGSFCGATLAARLPSRILEVGFGSVVLAIALWMFLGTILRLPQRSGEQGKNLKLVALCGFPIGVVTGLTGLGGGVFIVPLLVLWLNFPMQVAVGTSVAAIVCISSGGVAGYIVNGLGASVPPYSLGYINLPIWLSLAATSIPMAQLGARAAHSLPAKQLRYIFIACMAYIGLKMIGLF
jgi:uncharacterized membrane protein YfcA